MRTKNKDKELNHRHFIGLRLTDVELDLLNQDAAFLSAIFSVCIFNLSMIFFLSCYL